MTSVTMILAQLRLLLARPVLLGLLLLLLILQAWLTSQFCLQFVHLQAQGIRNLSFFAEVAIPLSGLSLLLGLLLALIFSSQSWPQLYSSAWFSPLLHSNNAAAPSFVGWTVSLVFLASLPLLLLTVSLYSLSAITYLDWAHGSVLMVMLLLLLLAFSALMMIVARFSHSPLWQLAIGGLILLLFAALDRLSALSDFALPIFTAVRQIQLGILDHNALAIILYLLWSLGIGLYLWQPKKGGKALWIVVFSFIALPLLYGTISRAMPNLIDLTHDKRYSINDRQAAELAQIVQPVEVHTALANEVAMEEITTAVNALRPFLKRIEVRPSNRQSLLGVKVSDAADFVLIKIGAASQLLAYPFDRPAKEALYQGITRLAKRKQRWIVFSEGFGEASPLGGKGTDFRQFAEVLSSQGWPVTTINLKQQAKVPDNTGLLVLASPKQSYSQSVVERITEYWRHGGAILLLRDPDDQLSPQLQALWGVHCESGTLIDWQGYQAGTPHPAIVVARDYTAHVVTSNLQGLMAMPWACALTFDEKSPLSWQVLVRSQPSVWNEREPDKQPIQQQQELGERASAFALLAIADGERGRGRMVVAADSQFLSDSAVNNYDNLQLGLNLVHWLNSAPLTDYQKRRDHYLDISSPFGFVAGFAFQGFMALLLWLILFTYTRWYRRCSLQLLNTERKS